MARREKGTGSVYFDKSKNRWVGEVKVGVTADGKVKKKKITGKTRSEVKQAVNLTQAEILTGVYVEPSELTIVQLAESINKNKYITNTIVANTYIKNQDTIKVLQRDAVLNSVPLQKLTEPMMIRYLSTLTDYSQSIIKRIYNCLSMAFKKAVRIDLISKNPLEEVSMPKSKKQTKKVNALTVTQQKALIEALNADRREPYRTMLLLQMLCGLRAGEVCALPALSADVIRTWKTLDITRTMTRDENYKQILGTTTKTYAGQRSLRLDENAVKVLLDYIENEYKPNKYDLLFLNKGKMVGVAAMNSYYKRLIERYHIADPQECNQHQLRHTYATRCIESGMPPKVLQKRLGHADIQTTLNTYCDVFEEFEVQYIARTEEYYKQIDIAI